MKEFFNKALFIHCICGTISCILMRIQAGPLSLTEYGIFFTIWPVIFLYKFGDFVRFLGSTKL